MRLRATVLRIALSVPLLAPCAAPAGTTAPASTTAAPAQKSATAQDDADWRAFGHALTLAQILMRSASAPDPDKAMDDVLAGNSTEANMAIAGLLNEATADMPAEYRARVASMGQDIASMARKQIGKPVTASPERALQARKKFDGFRGIGGERAVEASFCGALTDQRAQHREMPYVCRSEHERSRSTTTR